MISHYPEPWYVCGQFVKDSGGDHVATSHSNAYRIVSCVNACAGMDDPAAEIARLRECERLLRLKMADEWVI